MTDQNPGGQPHKRKLVSYIRIFIVPTLVLKVFMMYFGLNYSAYPGRGYGIGLAATFTLAIANFGFFLYLNRNETEDE